MTTTAADLATATPVEIDTALAAIYGQCWDAQDRLHVASERITEYGNAIARDPESYAAKHTYPARIEAEEALADIARADIASALADAEPLEAEFDRRGGWTRAFLVLTSGRGHVHRSMNCTTCYPSTQYAWITDYSGADEADIVAAAGEDACTVCYSSAPTTPRDRSMWAPSEIEADEKRQARAARAAELAARKAAKAITTPGGEPLRVFNYRRNETRRIVRGEEVVTPARDLFETLETAHAAKAWLTDAHEGWRSGKRPEDVQAVAEALAVKNGTSVEVEVEAARKRAAKRR